MHTARIYHTLTMLADGTVLAVGGEKSFGPTMAVVMRAAATDVQEVVIPDAGHWLMEEQPTATVAAVRAFLDGRPGAAAGAGSN